MDRVAAFSLKPSQNIQSSRCYRIKAIQCRKTTALFAEHPSKPHARAVNSTASLNRENSFSGHAPALAGDSLASTHA